MGVKSFQDVGTAQWGYFSELWQSRSLCHFDGAYSMTFRAALLPMTCPHLGRHSRRAIRILAVIALPRCFLTTTAPVIDDVLTSEGPRFRLQAGSGAARTVSVFSRRRRADMDWLPSTRVLHSRGTFPACWAVNKGSL